VIRGLFAGLAERAWSAAPPPRQRRTLSTKRELVDTASALLGPGLQDRFRRYIAWLDRQGYEFGSCEEIPMSLDRRRAYLRYDVHVRDFNGAVLLAALHEELQIPGSFQICWEHTRAESEVSDLFCKLQAFDPRYVQFGLHCSPESRWLISERFAGRSQGLETFVADGGAGNMIAEWFEAYLRDGHEAPVLRQALSRAEASLAETALSFRRAFGPAITVSAHGTSLSAAYLQAAAARPEVAAIAPYLHPVDFLTPERIAIHGFGRELTRFDDDGSPRLRIIFEGPIHDMASRYHERMVQGGGFIVLFHPLSWAGDYFVPFLDTVTGSAVA